MANEFTNILFRKHFEIEAGTAVSGRTERIQTLQILSGCAWVTVEGVSHDYWLSAGDEFVVTPHRLTVIEADRDDVRVTAVATPARDLLQVAKTWLAGLFMPGKSTMPDAGLVRRPRAEVCGTLVAHDLQCGAGR